MKKEIKLVEEFHKKFNGPVGVSPSLIEEKRSNLRYALMNEEVQEYLEGVRKGDLVNITKEICDILYTVYGTIVEHGLQDVIEEAFEENHKSQMTKDYTEGKMKKGASYVEADLTRILKN